MNRALRWGLFWVPLVAVTYLALTPSPPDPVFKISDVILHALAFYLLTGALASAHFELRLSPTWIWMLGYGVAIEAVQALTGRSPELKDLAVDAAGIAAALVTLRLLPGSLKARWLGGRASVD